MLVHHSEINLAYGVGPMFTPLLHVTTVNPDSVNCNSSSESTGTLHMVDAVLAWISMLE